MRSKSRWEKLISKITFEEPYPSYYQDMAIKPGYGFFKSLLAANKLPLTKLRIKIP